MINNKVVAFLIAVLTISGLSARRCYNKYGERIRCHRNAGEFVGDTARGAGETAANILTLGGYSRAKEDRRRDVEYEDEDEIYDEEGNRID